MGVLGDGLRVAGHDIGRPDVALSPGRVAQAPGRDPQPFGRPARMRCVLLQQHRPLTGFDVENPEVRVVVSTERVRYGHRAHRQLRAVGRPVGHVTTVVHAAGGLAGRAHDVDATAIALPAKGDALTVRRKRRIGRVVVASEGNRVCASDALEHDGGVTLVIGLVHHHRPVR